VIVEKETFLYKPARLKEYRIEYKYGEHVLGGGGGAGGAGVVNICNLETGTGKEEGQTRLAVVECRDEGEDSNIAASAVIVVVCNVNETVEFVRIVKATA
jgi:hypothetical protein